MNTLSHKHSKSSRQRIWARCRRNGDNAIYLYASNVGDDKRYPVNTKLSLAVVRTWVPLLKQLNAMGLRPIIWFFADDSKSISTLPTARLTNYVRQTISIIDPYVIGYVPALEANEHMGFAKTKAISNAIRASGSKPIGIHTTRDLEKNPKQLRAWASLGQEWFHQYGFDQKPAQIAAESRQVRQLLGRPFVAAEYHKSATTAGARALGDAALSGGAHSTGNGANRGGGPVKPTPGPSPAPRPTPGPAPGRKPRLGKVATVKRLREIRHRAPIAIDAAIIYIQGGAGTVPTRPGPTPTRPPRKGGSDK